MVRGEPETSNHPYRLPQSHPAKPSSLSGMSVSPISLAISTHYPTAQGQTSSLPNPFLGLLASSLAPPGNPPSWPQTDFPKTYPHLCSATLYGSPLPWKKDQAPTLLSDADNTILGTVAGSRVGWDTTDMLGLRATSGWAGNESKKKGRSLEDKICPVGGSS